MPAKSTEKDYRNYRLIQEDANTHYKFACLLRGTPEMVADQIEKDFNNNTTTRFVRQYQNRRYLQRLNFALFDKGLDLVFGSASELEGQYKTLMRRQANGR